MSLVEKALLKIQANQQSRVPAQAPSAAIDQAATAEAPLTSEGREYNPAAIAFVPTGPTVQIDLDSLRAAGLLAPAGQERILARQLRGIKQGLLRRMQDAVAADPTTSRTIMVTSGLPGDGKSFTSFNLAMSLALEKDFKVVLVDSDVAKPHITTALGLAGRRGLMEVLSEQDSEISSVVRATSIAGLYFVPAGYAAETATELLSSGRMARWVQYLAQLEHNLIVVFDSPPMLLTSEAQALAAVMNQILVVVRSEVTPQSIVNQTLGVLAANQGARVSLLLNNAKNLGLTDYTYGYGYQFQSQ